MAQTAPSNDDQRHTARKRVLRMGKIVYGDYRYIVDCVVRDHSAEGARLKSENPQDIPDAFYLFVKTDAMLYPARTMWKKGKEIGIRFEGEQINLITTKDARLRRFAYM